MDASRKFDLEELAKSIKKATSVAEREYYEKIAFRIINESAPVRSLRDDLIKAIRVNDYVKVRKIQQHIQAIRLDETGGTSWGNQKGNRKRLN